jgi:hypothetical protein
MRKALQQKAKVLACGLGMGALMAVPVIGMASGTAGADGPGCYTGCTAPTSGVTSANADGSPTTSPVTSSSTLAFTGADLGEMALIGIGAVGAGTLLVRRSRRSVA